MIWIWMNVLLKHMHFFRFLLKDGQLWLCEPQAKQIWLCLAENAIYVTDRENCFKWFSKVGKNSKETLWKEQIVLYQTFILLIQDWLIL